MATLNALSQLVESTRRGVEAEPDLLNTAKASMDALRSTIGAIRRRENDILDARIRADNAASLRVKGLAIVTTGLATALLTLIVALLVFVARPGVWRG